MFIVSLGTYAIATNAIGSSLAAVFQIPASALSLTIVTVVGQCIGRGNIADARKFIKSFVAWRNLARLNGFDFDAALPTVGRAVQPASGNRERSVRGAVDQHARAGTVVVDKLYFAFGAACGRRLAFYLDHFDADHVAVPGDSRLYYGDCSGLEHSRRMAGHEL